MPLTSIQLQALQILDWLYDRNNHRAEGRTYVIAISLIRQALRYPGTPIPIWDHYYSGDGGRFRGAAHRNLWNRIEQFIGEDPELAQYVWEFPHNGEELRLITPNLTDTLPSHWLPASMRSTPEETLAQSMLEEEDARILEELEKELAKKSSWDIISDDEDEDEDQS
jgi:hypothetical protein